MKRKSNITAADDTRKCRILTLSLNNRAGEKLIESVAVAKGGAQ